MEHLGRCKYGVRDTNTFCNDRREAASAPLLKLELLGGCDYL